MKDESENPLRVLALYRFAAATGKWLKNTRHFHNAPRIFAAFTAHCENRGDLIIYRVCNSSATAISRRSGRNGWTRDAKSRAALCAPQLSHDEKIARLEQHRSELARWLRFQPLRFFWSLDSHTEARYVRGEMRRIAAAIEKVQKSKARLARWRNENPTHPHNRRAM